MIFALSIVLGLVVGASGQVDCVPGCGDTSFEDCSAVPPTCISCAGGHFPTYLSGNSYPATACTLCTEVPGCNGAITGLVACTNPTDSRCLACSSGLAPSGDGSTCLCDPGTEADDGACVPICASVCGDPHFQGLNGIKYDFKGEPDKIFALVSDVDVEVNALFIRSGSLTTLGPVCIHTCAGSITILPNHTAFVNDGVIKPGHYASAGVDITYGNSATLATLDVKIGDKWEFQIAARRGRVDIDHAIPIHVDKQIVHGVLGHTLHSKPKEAEKCNSIEEGGCLVEGEFSDYEVSGGLCSTTWKHSAFRTCK